MNNVSWMIKPDGSIDYSFSIDEVSGTLAIYMDTDKKTQCIDLRVSEYDESSMDSILNLFRRFAESVKGEAETKPAP